MAMQMTIIQMIPDEHHEGHLFAKFYKDWSVFGHCKTILVVKNSHFCSEKAWWRHYDVILAPLDDVIEIPNINQNRIGKISEHLQKTACPKLASFRRRRDMVEKLEGKKVILLMIYAVD